MNLTECDRLFERIRRSCDPDELRLCYHRLFEFYPLINYQIGRGSIFWRGRKSPANGYEFTWELHCPTPEKTNIGRLNNKSEPCLYAATRRTTIFRELDAKEGDYIHVVGLRILPKRPIKIIAIGDLFHIYKTGHARSIGRDPGKNISRMLNSYDHEHATKILYVDAFLGDILSDPNAKDKNYLHTRVLASTPQSLQFCVEI